MVMQWACPANGPTADQTGPARLPTLASGVAELLRDLQRFRKC